MRTIHRSCHRCPFPKPPPLLQATAVTPPGRKPIFHLPSEGSCDGEPLSLAEEAKRELARVGMHHGIQCACTVHLLRVFNAIGPYICGVSTAMGAFTTWLEWSVEPDDSRIGMR